MYDENRIYFGGTAKEIEQAFDDLEIPRVTFFYVLSSSLCPDYDPKEPLFGFDYFTSHPGHPEAQKIPNPFTRKGLINFLARSLENMTKSDKVHNPNKDMKMVWDLVGAVEKSGEVFIKTRLVTVDKNLTYQQHRESLHETIH